MKRIVLSSFLFVLSILSLMAQNNTLDVHISGTIKDASSGESVPYATVSIRPAGADTTQVFRQVTDGNGYFVIGLLAAPSYHLTASFVGMKTHTMQISRENGQHDIKSIDISLESEDKQLSTVTVSAARPLVKMEIDRLSYNMKDDPAAKTNNLLEMLRNVPLVTVDGQGNIQVKGSSNFKIHLNGRPSTMVSSNPKEVFRSIPAHTIKRVEVITDPGVKYDAEGTSAILNIVTEEGKKLEGYSGSITASVSNNPTANGSIFLTAKSGKVGLTTNYNYYGGKNKGSRYFTERTTSMLQTIEEGKGQETFGGHFGNALLSFEIDSLNLFTVGGNVRLWEMTTDRNSVEKSFAGSNLMSYIDRKLKTQMDAGSYELNADYQHSTRLPGELLTVSYRFTHNPNNSETFIDQWKRDPLNTANTIQYAGQHSKSDAGMDEHTAQVDYTRPLGQAHSLEAGLKYIYRHATSDPLYEIRPSEDAPWQPGSLYAQNPSNGKFRHDQYIGAAYADYNYRKDQYSLQTGLRVESSRLKALFPENAAADFSHNSFDWVPQLTLGYTPSPMKQLKLAYNFRIQRPAIGQLNPYRLQTNDYQVQYGNPDLKSEKRHHVGLSYNQYGAKVMLTASLDYDFCNNAIQNYTFSDPANPNLFHQTYGNIGREHSFSLNTYAMYTPAVWVRIMLNGNIDRTFQKSEALGIDVNSWSGMVYSGLMFTLPKDWTVNLFGGYYHGGRSYQTKYDGNVFNNIGIAKQLFDKKLRVSLSANNIHAKYSTWKSRTIGNGFTIYSENAGIQRSVSLSLTYSFGKMNTQVRKVQRTIVNDDLKQTSSQGQQGGGQGNPTGN
ncbi:outer membrane beta-barrel family protein [Porphyromonas gingivalis]|uniref:outer membrane beta-barrel family protein n=1 Tax=Porphyromonas gingivalis TaxID=837 RepID=UPI00097CDCF8|nr:outer membrane beta-barrel family protein [Porphyromonas gingivalis]SJM19914.1 TonB-dependent receptor [Porphyromonas gingivalis]